MSILSEQLVISNKVISNDIELNQDARSVTMQNGYYVDHKYPDNRASMEGHNPWNGTNNIATSDTAGQIG